MRSVKAAKGPGENALPSHLGHETWSARPRALHRRVTVMPPGRPVRRPSQPVFRPSLGVLSTVPASASEPASSHAAAAQGPEPPSTAVKLSSRAASSAEVAGLVAAAFSAEGLKAAVATFEKEPAQPPASIEMAAAARQKAQACSARSATPALNIS